MQVFFIGDLNYRIDEMETEEILSLATAADPQVGAPLHLTASWILKKKIVLHPVFPKPATCNPKSTDHDPKPTTRHPVGAALHLTCIRFF